MLKKMAESLGVFIMPIYIDDHGISEYIEHAVSGISSQTDANWHIIFIEDCSPLQDIALKLLDKYCKKYPHKTSVIYNAQNQGPGFSRNKAIELAYSMGASFVLYNDQDDISDIHRLERVRSTFLKHPEAVVVYSKFDPIDEIGNLISMENLTFSIKEILDCYQYLPSGNEMWYSMGIETGYINLTSATSVLTEVAKKFPFRGMTVSEDFDAWLRYSTEGSFQYLADTPTKYRLPTNTKGSTSRSRHTDFYRLKSQIDFNAFCETLNILLNSKKLDASKMNLLKAKFKLRMINTFLGEDRLDLVAEEAIEARNWLKQVN